MAARQTTYTDAQGNAQTGYIINNQTYKDAAGTQRIDNGSIVTADSGKQYVMTDAGGVLYDDYVKQSAPQAKQTQYIDPTGRSATGYIIDNRTYKDAAGTQRIDNGSLVTNASGTQTWVMTDKGGVPYEEYMAQQRKSEQNELIQQMLANAQEQQRLINEDNIRQLEAQLPKINETYDETLNQAYQGYRSAEKSLANQLAASGLYNSGYSDTAKVNQATAYGNQRNATERERAEAITGVNENIASQNIQNNAALLELQNQYNQLLLDQSNLDRDYDLQEKQVEHNISQDLWNNEQYLDDKQWSRAWDEDEREWSRKWDEDERDWSRKWNEDEREYERNQTAKQEELQKALYAIDHGGDYSLLAEYLGGVDLSMAEQYWKANMQALIREANLSGYKSTTGSSKSASEKLDALTKREVEMEAESLIRI